MTRKVNRQKHIRHYNEHGFARKHTGPKGFPFRHAIAKREDVDFINHLPVKREYYLHATKGYRSVRAL